MNSSSERSPADAWSRQADQLRQVDRDIRSVELRIAQGETIDRSNDEYEVDLNRYLDSLREERAEIEKSLQSHVQAIEPHVGTDQVTQPIDPYRFADRPIGEIRDALTRIKGWEGARNRLNRHYAADGLPVSADDLLEEWVRQVQAGTRPVRPGMWSEIYDRYTLNGEAVSESAKAPTPSKRPSRKKGVDQNARLRERRDFDADDWREQEALRDDPAAERHAPIPDEARRIHEKLITYPQNGYDIDNQGSASVTNPEESRPEPEAQPQRSHQEILADSLRRAAELDESSADMYTAPASPLDNQSHTREPQGYNERATDFARQLHELDDARRAQAGEKLRAGNVDTFDETREKLAPGEFRAGDQIFRVGERVYYTENDGDRAEHVIMGPSESDPPGLILKNWAENRQFFVDPENIAARVERIGESTEDPREPGDTTERDREGGEQFIPEDLLERIPKEPTREDILRGSASLREGLDARIKGVAEAKEEREKLFYLGGKKRKEALAESTDELEQAYAQYMDNWAARLAAYRGVGDQIREAKTGLQEDLAEREASLARIEADQDLSPAAKERRIETKRQAIAQTRAAIAECDRRIEGLDATLELVTHEAEIQMTLELAQARSKIETAQSELKEGKLSQKFKNWWRGHPKTRFAIGVGLGIGGLALGGIPGVAMMAGAAAMRGVGGYMGTEAGWNLARQFRANRSDRKSAEAAAAETSEGAKMQAAAKTENLQGSNPEMSDQTKADLDLFMQRHASELYSQQAIQKILRGESESSAEVASMLVGDQLSRVNKDASSNRHAKVAGAIVGTGAAALGLWRTLDQGGAKPAPSKAPKPPYDPNADRWYGMASENPQTMVPNWEAMHAAATPEAVAAAKAAGSVLDRAYDSVSQGMSLGQLRQLNGIIGAGARTIGNEKVADLLPRIATQVKNGVPAEKIMESYNIPTQIT